MLTQRASSSKIDQGVKQSNNNDINSQREIQAPKFTTNKNGAVILIGDSIIKHIEPRKLSQRQVHKNTFPRKRAEVIAKEICSITHPQTDVSHVIIHAGTYNLPIDSVKQCVQNIKNLVNGVKNRFPNAKIGISGLIVRYDIDVASKVQEVNKELVLIITCFILTILM